MLFSLNVKEVVKIRIILLTTWILCTEISINNGVHVEENEYLNHKGSVLKTDESNLGKNLNKRAPYKLNEPAIVSTYRNDDIYDKKLTNIKKFITKDPYLLSNVEGSVGLLIDTVLGGADHYTQTKQLLKQSGIKFSEKSMINDEHKLLYDKLQNHLRKLNDEVFGREKFNSHISKKDIWSLSDNSKSQITVNNNIGISHHKKRRNSNIANSSKKLQLKTKYENARVKNDINLGVLAKLLNTNVTDLAKKITAYHTNFYNDNMNFIDSEMENVTDTNELSVYNQSSSPTSVSLDMCSPFDNSSISDSTESSAKIQCFQTNVNIDEVLLKILDKLKYLEECRRMNTNEVINSPQNTTANTTENTTEKITPVVQLEDAPCYIKGGWNSHALGLRFTLNVKTLNQYNSKINSNLSTQDNTKDRHTNTKREAMATDLEVMITEKHPPKPHVIMDTQWLIHGSALNLVGGPFYLYTKREDEKLLGTFLGYCRTCGGMDTIFGSWAFIFPSKDCQDISTVVQNRRDILRRDRLEEKLKEKKHFNKKKSKRKVEIPKNCEEELKYQN